MKEFFNKSELKNYLMIMVGITILAIGINVYYSPQHLVTGGVSGLAIILDYVFSIPLWLTNVIVNIPLFIVGIKIKGMDFAKKSIFGAAFVSVALWYTSFIPPVQSDLLISSVFGGLFVGAGVGLVLRSSASTGGTDLLAIIIKHYLKKIPINQIMMCIDGMIIVVGLFVFGVEKAMYALISIFIVSKVVNTLVEGVNYSKEVHIISEKSSEIAQELMKHLNRGITSINGKGVYTGKSKDILYIVCSTEELIELQRIVKEVDTEAFIIINDVREVVGRGFTQPQYDGYKEEK
ncbi:MAG: YitT family protein [Clostridium sulfidigenes]|uniref:YitT family protein n=1 Tax=Clostridium sulfidigenes TaxID=318464 RepID=A0A927WAP4_9CLOT|nr:YitT family protein [Clostridium sulfidigenes]